MKVFISLILILFATSSLAWAQSPEVPESTLADSRAMAKDSIANDPSTEQLKLPRVIPQQTLALKGVGDLILGGLFIDLYNTVFKQYPGILKNHPEWFDLLRIHQDRYEPAIENGPTLVNADYEFDGISDKKFGYCWGFATFLRNFLTLAFYDPNQPRLANPEDYEAIIRRLSRGKATVIPGFANLREMSSVPQIELLLKLEAMRLWKKKAIHLSSLGVYLKTAKPMDFSASMDLVSDLETRLARGELPKIIFSSKTKASGAIKLSRYIHVVLVNGIEHREDGGARIRIWDVNFYAETLMRSPKYLEINPDGTIVYEPWFEPGTEHEADSRFIARISYAPENDRETAKFVKELKRFCGRDATSSWCR